MTLRYRRNAEADNLEPPLDAYTDEEWELFQRYYESLSPNEATEVLSGSTAAGRNCFLVQDDVPGLIFAPVWPRQPEADRLDETVDDSLWLVSVDPDAVAAYDLASDSGVRVEDDFMLIRGDYRVASRRSLEFRDHVVRELERGHTAPDRLARIIEEQDGGTNAGFRVEIVDDVDGDEVAGYDTDLVIHRDQLVGWYWIVGTDENGERHLEGGPYETEREAEREADRAIERDDRTDYERGRNMSGRAVAADRNERTQEEQERASRQELSLERDVRDETIALVYKPRSRTVPSPARILSVVAISTRKTVIQFGDKNFGEGYLDTEDIEGCARTHTPSGVLSAYRGTGYGLSLYTSLATIAYQGYEMECIGSSPTSRAYGSRSEDADKWWSEQLSRGLANEGDCNGCAYIRLEDLVDAGLIVWMAYPGAYEGALADAREKYLEAFLSAEPDPEQDSIELIDQVLSAHASAEAMAEWRAAHREEAEPPAVATANRRRAGRRPRRPAPVRAGKPSFVTPALEAHVDQQYAWLQE